MNLLRSRLIDRDDQLLIEIGGVFPLPSRLPSERSGLREYAGRGVVVGIRPEDMEDATLVPGLNGRPTLDVRMTLAELMGAEVMAYFPVAGHRQPAVHGVPTPPEENESDAALRVAGSSAAAGELTLTARLSPRSPAATGRSLRIVVDTARLHFFDPDSEASIW